MMEPKLKALTTIWDNWMLEMPRRLQGRSTFTWEELQKQMNAIILDRWQVRASREPKLQDVKVRYSAEEYLSMKKWQSQANTVLALLPVQNHLTLHDQLTPLVTQMPPPRVVTLWMQRYCLPQTALTMLWPRRLQWMATEMNYHLLRLQAPYRTDDRLRNAKSAHWERSLRTSR